MNDWNLFAEDWVGGNSNYHNSPDSERLWRELPPASAWFATRLNRQ
jgi:hypothetical protein